MRPLAAAAAWGLLLSAGCGEGPPPARAADGGAGGSGSVAGRLPGVRDARGRPPIHFDGGIDEPVPAPPEPALHIGVPGSRGTDPAFTPLQPGGDIPLDTFGQGATHGVFMVQVVGLGPRTWIDLTMRNLDAGNTLADAGLPGEVASIDGGDPEPLTCTGEEDAHSVCVRGPFIVLTTGLAEPEEMNGLHVEVTASAVNAVGHVATDRTDGYFRQQF